MKLITRYLIIGLTVISQNIFAQEHPAFQPVKDLFAAMSNVDHSRMKQVVTNDFILLENGEVWTIDDLAAVVGPSDYKRTNYFKMINIQSHDNIAWINYWNKANFSNGENSQDVVWLESVVIVQKEAVWLISQMHSTKLEPNKVPQNIGFTRL